MFSWQKHATMLHHPTALPPTGARDMEKSRRFNEFPASMKNKNQGGGGHSLTNHIIKMQPLWQDLKSEEVLQRF